jgi:hypothetical protein
VDYGAVTANGGIAAVVDLFAGEVSDWSMARSASGSSGACEPHINQESFMTNKNIAAEALTRRKRTKP